MKKLDIKQNPFFGSAAFINIAQAAQRVCVSDYKKNYTIPLPVLGNAICTKRQVIDELLPILKEKIDVSLLF